MPVSRHLTVLIAAALVVTACSGDPEPSATPAFSDTPRATETATPEPTTEEPAPEPTTDPTTEEASEPTIDVAYVDDFMAQANAVTGEVLELVRQTGSTTEEEVIDLYRSVVTPRAAEEVFDAFGGDLSILAEPVGTPTSTTLQVLQADDDCVLAVIDYDNSPLLRDDLPRPADGSSWHLLLLPGETNERMDLPWRIDQLFAFIDATPPTTCAEYNSRTT